ncbi:MAG: SPASM domain-containing protein [Elusimicrobiota bacterium]
MRITDRPADSKAVRERRLRKLFIEITDVCNLSCSFCPKTARKPEFMSERLFSKILKDAQGWVEELFFHVMGEPLLHPELGAFLDLCAQRSFKVKLVTNGTLIGKAGEMLLGKTALKQISFSLHGLDDLGAGRTPASGGPAAPLGSAGLAGEAHPPEKEAILAEIRDFSQKAAQAGICVFLRHWDADPKSASARAFAESQKISSRVFVSSMARFAWPSLDCAQERDEGSCLGMRRQAAVLVDGTVVPCCLDKDGIMALGNVRERSLREIVDSERARRIAEGFSRGKAVEPLCRRCRYKDRFK